MKRQSPPALYTASELRPLVHASENMLLRLAELGGIKMANGGGMFMGFKMESSFLVSPDEIEEIKGRLLAARARGLIVD
jgi:hypothetical protein